MGARALFGVLLGFALVAAAVSLARCLVPDRKDKIEWVQRPEAIVVQMKDLGGLAQSDVYDRLSLPGFTLYGDGTLLFTTPSERGQAAPASLRKATMTPEAIEHLLRFIEDEGFLNFSYEQPKPGVSDYPTTYLYAGTKGGANAVSAYALDAGASAGAEWNQFRKLQEIRRRLNDLSGAASDGGYETYRPEAIVLFVERTPPVGMPLVWLFSDIDLAGIAPESGVGEQRIDGELAQGILNSATRINGGLFTQGGGVYSVWYRPVLPYEENFPEFEPVAP